jgi:hypothetical protein
MSKTEFDEPWLVGQRQVSFGFGWLKPYENPYRALPAHAIRIVYRELTAHPDLGDVELRARWQDLFGAKFDVLLYDLTSTYFESDPPFPEGDQRRFGSSRDHRPDCVQVVVALIVTPEGYPLACEVLPGNTSDKTTLAALL